MATFIRKKFFLFLILAVIILIVWKRAELWEAIVLWRGFKWYYLLLAIGLQFVNYGAASLVYHSLLKTQGNNFSVNHVFRAVTVMLFFNRALPSLGISGGAYMVERLHQDGMSRGRALIIAILYYNNYYLSFFILLLAGFFYLFFQHDLAKANVLASVIAVGIVVIAFAAIIYVVSQERRLFLWAGRLIKLGGRLSRRLNGFFASRQEKINSELRDIYKSWRHYWKDFRHMTVPFLASMLQHFAEISTLYIIFLALGHPVSVWVLTVGYISAGVLSFVTFVPNGIGVYEATMILLLNGLEVPLPIALSGVLAFRALFYWLPIPVGFYFYRHFEGSAGEKKIFNPENK